MVYRGNLIALIVVVLGLCMLVPVAQGEGEMIPIRDVKEVAGKWEGNEDAPDGRYTNTLIFNTDGTGAWVYPKDSPMFTWALQDGSIPYTWKLIEGKIRIKASRGGALSTAILNKEGSKRHLRFQTDDGTRSGIYEPAK